jgi:hypothetical protein
VGRFVVPSARGVADRRLDEVVLKALERDPERRYQHARELKGALDSFLGQAEASTQTTRTASAPRAGGSLLRNPLAWASLLCLAGVAVCFQPFWPWAELLVLDRNGRPIPLGQVHSFDSPAGLALGATFLVLWFVLLASGAGRPRWWQSPLLFLAGLVPLLVLLNGGLFLSSRPSISDPPKRTTTTRTSATVRGLLERYFSVDVQVTTAPGAGCRGSYDYGGRRVVVEAGESNGLSLETPLGPLRREVYAWPYLLVGLGLALSSLGCLQIRGAGSPGQPRTAP